jgi:8-oxo-dGTP pyrophosphatase MutT (NUDIX family)
MDSAAVIVEDATGHVLLLLRGPTAPRGALQWCLPSGFAQSGEDVASTARRETHEEAGLIVGTLVPVARARSGGGTLHVFCTFEWDGPVQLLDGEHVTHAWVPRTEAASWDVVSAQRAVLRGYIAATSAL